MRNSNSFQRDDDRLNESQQQLPKEWDYLSKRLAEVEKGLTILQKKHSKLDKKLNNYTREVGEFNSQLTEEVLNMKSSMMSKTQIKQEISHNLELLQKQIKRSCNELITNRLDNRNQTVELKIKSMSDQTKLYVDRAVFELKQLLKKYVKQQSELQKKIQKSSRQNSPSFVPRATINKSTSAKKLMYDVATKQDNVEKDSQSGWLSKSRGNFSKDSVASGNSNRVSYLREKLKQFQKINKKYQTVPDKIEQKTQNEQIVKKMRNYREYLQQSQSELQPSNFLNSEDITSYSSSKKNNYALF